MFAWLLCTQVDLELGGVASRSSQTLCPRTFQAHLVVRTLHPPAFRRSLDRSASKHGGPNWQHAPRARPKLRGTIIENKENGPVSVSYTHLLGWAHNPKVGGSNPPPATNSFNQLQPLLFKSKLSFHNSFHKYSSAITKVLAGQVGGVR